MNFRIPESPEFVTLGEDLKSRAIAYHVHSLRQPYSDSYVKALGAASGKSVRVERRWYANHPTLPYAYNLELQDGKLYHVPSIFVAVDPVRDAAEKAAGL